MAPFCQQCQDYTEQLHDYANGQVLCARCGLVLEESSIEISVEFQEDSFGNARSTSQFVDGSGVARSRNLRGANPESREITLRKALGDIQTMAANLRIGSQGVESAHRLFKLALEHNFNRGRRREMVVAACLYIVCRREKTAHMLLDFSEVLKTDVYKIGHTFVQLVRLLKLELPVVEPWLYVRRFAENLEFGDKTHDVVNTSLKLVSRMSRDWMQIGRRPAGICAAALLIAARVHGFRRSKEEIVQVVRICKATLTKRLKEFDETPAAQMTPEEFEKNADKLAACDPPSFALSRAKQQDKEQVDALNEQQAEAETSSSPVTRKRTRISAASKEATKKQKTAEAESASIEKEGYEDSVVEPQTIDTAQVDALASELASMAQSEEFVDIQRDFDVTDRERSTESGAVAANASDELDAELAQLMPIKAFVVENENTTENENEAEVMAESARQQELVAAKEGYEPKMLLDEVDKEKQRAHAEMNGNGIGYNDMDNESAMFAKGKAKKGFEDEPTEYPSPSRNNNEKAGYEHEYGSEFQGDYNDSYNEENVATSSLQSTSNAAGAAQKVIEEEEQENFDDIDDDELDQYVMTDEDQVKLKETIWAEINKDFLEQQAKKAKEAGDNEGKPKRTRRRKTQAGEQGPASSAAEATARMLSKRSSKVNYTALNTLFAIDPAALDNTGPTALVTEDGQDIPEEEFVSFLPTSKRISDSIGQIGDNNNNSFEDTAADYDYDYTAGNDEADEAGDYYGDE